MEDLIFTFQLKRAVSELILMKYKHGIDYNYCAIGKEQAYVQFTDKSFYKITEIKLNKR